MQFTTLEDFLTFLSKLNPGDSIIMELHDFHRLSKTGLSPILMWLSEQKIHVAITSNTPSRLIGLNFLKK